MVEAAVRSADSGERVRIDTVLDEAYAAALDIEVRDEVAAALAGWGSAGAGLERVPRLAS